MRGQHPSQGPSFPAGPHIIAPWFPPGHVHANILPGAHSGGAASPPSSPVVASGAQSPSAWFWASHSGTTAIPLLWHSNLGEGPRHEANAFHSEHDDKLAHAVRHSAVGRVPGQ